MKIEAFAKRLLGSLLKMCFSSLKILKPLEAVLNSILWNAMEFQPMSPNPCACSDSET